ncbi:LAMI_0D04852g1_1 [Lachancea mirantina]|uniref:High osmolarity signaling protein SHO1 n=1 Tax=Lachancea mirantina TaxID=1230905 RepID=A0A1G4JAM8_9SACH|nr:LAMI_0D04852g1_1 [Lachancea mirantina]
MSVPTRLQAKQMRSRPHQLHTFGISNLLTDPFAISSLSIGLIAWIVTIAGSIPAASTTDSFPRFTWWGIVYEFLVMVAITVFYCFDIVAYYKTFLTGAIAVAFVYTTNSATYLVYNDGSSMAAASAGVILLSMINLIWIFYFGGDSAAPTNRWIDSYSLKGIRHSVLETSIALSENAYPRAASRHVSRYSSSPRIYDNAGPPDTGFYPESQHYVSSTALNGFENTEPPSAPALNSGNLNANNINTYITDNTNGNTETTMGDTLGLYSDAGDEQSSFPYTARALYSYNADASDAYEISFEQGEILKVGDIEGRWWKAKRSNGDTGIIPSNYVQLIEDDVV